MASSWVSVMVVQLFLIHGLKTDSEMNPCAEIQTLSSVVLMGSTVTATCVIKDDCLVPAEQQPVDVEWRLGDGLIPSSSRVVVLSNFNHSRVFLTCSIKDRPSLVLAGLEIRAGYPPEVPDQLRCQTNLSSPITLTCSWNPGLMEPLIRTTYSLHTEIRDSNQNFSYGVAPGVHQVSIPRPDMVLFSDMKITVKAVNELGESTSESIMVEPVSSAKFDPPQIKNVEVVPQRFGCLRIRWSLFKLQDWMRFIRFNLELRMKTIDETEWKEPILIRGVRPSKPLDQSRLLHGTQYVFQIRVRYQQSPWSEWSSSQSGVTLERAPSGCLGWWMKVSKEPEEVSVLLFWKPSKQFRANGQNLSFVVSVQKQGKGRLCSTSEKFCSFTVPRRIKRVFLSALNAAGKSSPTEIHIYSMKDLRVLSEVSAVPQDEGLLVQWRTAPGPLPPTAYLLEWRPLLQTHPSYLQFEHTQRNQTKFLIAGDMLQPYQPYSITVYPWFKDSLGFPLTVQAYLSQKAPAMVPKIKIKDTWDSHIELTWDEIPLSQRNGIIQNYTIYYWDDKGHTKMLEAGPDDMALTLTDVSSECVYEAFMMVSTSGGSLNGSIFHFKKNPLDSFTIDVILTMAVGVPLFICSVLVCFWKNKRLKKEFWPIVPDPANSSIKRWNSDSTQDSHFPRENEEQHQMYMSHLSFLELPVKTRKEDEDDEDDVWTSEVEDTSDLGESICGSPVLPSYSGSNSDSVPYATVIFPSPTSSVSVSISERRGPPAYVRSESTQPLLEAEDSFTPQSYQNVPVLQFFGPDDGGPDDGEDPENLWNDFPFLQALALNDSTND